MIRDVAELKSADTTEPAVIPALMVIFALPLKDVAVPVTSPLIAIVLAVCKVVAVDALPVKAAVIVPAAKFPLASRATIADVVFALVAFDVTVNVEPVDWLAVKLALPDNPVPETANVNVPSPGVDDPNRFVATPAAAAVKSI